MASSRKVRGSGSAAPERSGFSGSQGAIDLPTKLHEWQRAGDERLWKIIISPEFGSRVDLEKLTREVLSRMEWDLDTKLEWAAVAHFNTDHPHVHVAVRGRRQDGTALRLSGDYVRSGIRLQAEEACTLQLGYRTQLDGAEAEAREVSQRRFTSLDRLIARRAVATESSAVSANYFVVTEEPPQQGASTFVHLRAQHLQARLVALAEMDLAIQTAPKTWNIRKDFEVVLRAMQRTGDRQKILAAHGRELSDPRLPLTAEPNGKVQRVEGLSITHKLSTHDEA